MSSTNIAALAQPVQRALGSFAMTGVRASPAFVAFTQTHLASAFALEVAEIEERMHLALEEDGRRDRVHFFGVALDRRLLEAKVRRVSPAALALSSHHRAAWMIRALDFCPESMEFLVDVCPACGCRLGWTKCKSLKRCDGCDSLLTSHPGKLVPADLRADARAAALIISTDPEVRRNAMAVLPVAFASWSPGDVFAALVEFGAAVGTATGSEAAVNRAIGAGRFDGFGVADLVAGYRFATTWPDSLIEHVRQKYEAQGSTSAARCLGTLGKYMASTSAPSPLRDLIRREAGKAIHAAGIPAKLYARNADGGAERTGVVTAREAEARFKITRRTLSRLEGKSPTFRGKSPGQKGTSLYDLRRLEVLADARDRSVTTDAAACRLGIPIHAVRPLADANLITEATDPDLVLVYEVGRIEISSIERLRTTLTERSTPEIPGGVSLGDALRSEVRPSAWARVVEKLMAGELLACLSSDPEGFLGAAFVAKQPLASTLEACGEEPDGVVSCLAAARILGTSEQFVAAATQAGYLVGVVRPRKSEISLQSVQRFAASYLLSTEVAERVGCNPAAVRRRMRAHGFTPVATIYRCNLWDRASFVCDEKEILNRLVVSKAAN